MEAAEYLDIIPARKKTAFIVHLLEYYKETHPYGPDWEAVDKINRSVDRSYMPKTPILQNLQKAGKQTGDGASSLVKPLQAKSSPKPDPQNNTEQAKIVIDLDVLEDLKELGVL